MRQNLPTVMVYGEPDDHLRLTVLLASLLDVRDEDAKQVCRSLKATWSERTEALENLLKSASGRSNRLPIRVIDIDALDVQTSENEADEERLEEHTFVDERREVFGLLLQAYDPDGWEIVRPNPRQDTTRTLTDAGISFITPLTAHIDGKIVESTLVGLVQERVSTPVRPILLSMVKRGKMADHEALQMLEKASDNLDESILSMALDTLAVRGMEVAMRLALLRGPNVLNGKAGGFTILEPGQEKNWLGQSDGLPRDGIQALIDASFIDVERTSRGDRFIMSNMVRDYLRDELELVHRDDEIEAMHHVLCEDDEDLERKVEVQYHAMATHDPNLAREHTYYYANHLRQLGRWLSQKKNDYGEAVNIFKFITECDANDAYAWEYYAYNLAMQGQKSASGLSEQIIVEIRRAYERACEIEPENPMFRGRQIGFFARTNTPIGRHFAEFVRRFRKIGSWHAEIFAQHALRGVSDRLERGRLVKGHEYLKKNPEIKALLP